MRYLRSGGTDNMRLSTDFSIETENIVGFVKKRESFVMSKIESET
jgi:hypothetical protein